MNDDVERGVLLAPADGATTGSLHRCAAEPSASATAGRAPAFASDGATATLRLVRADDQLDVRIELFDVDVTGDEVSPTGAAPAMRLSFGSQHVAEGAFAAPGPTPPTSVIAHIAAGDSVVVVPITDPFPLTVDGVLAVTRDGLIGQPTAGTPGGGATAIEVPAGLVLSPTEPASLAATRRPFTVDSVSEVWTANLTAADGTASVQLAAVANLSSQDLVNAGPPTASSRVPDAAARDDLVANTTGAPTAPIAARRFALTSSGAFVDLHGEWSVGLALYDHRIRAGRDVRVEVSGLGYLVPFGHRAAIVEVSQRVFASDAGGVDTAVLVVERHLQIIEAVVTSPRPFERHIGRGLPLTTVTVSADETAPITLQPVVDLAGRTIDGAFDLRARDSELDIHHLSVDRAGNTVAFALPATFVDDSVAYDTGADGAPARLRALANEASRLPRREVDLAGQLVAYADPLTPTSPVSKHTHAFTLSWDSPEPLATTPDLASARTPAIFAALEHADVVDDAVSAVTGDVGELIGVTLHQRWLELGNVEDNFDKAFLTLDERTTSRIGGDSIVRGVAQLDMVAEVFNQRTGAGPDLDVPGAFDVGDIVGHEAKIIGNILLEQVIELVEDELPGTEITIDDDGSITTEYTFCPTLHDLPAAGFKTTDDTRCCVHLSATASVADGIEASFTTELRVQDFLLEFPPIAAPLVVVDVASVVGTIHSDGPATIVPTIREWDFSGTISLLLSLVDSLGFGNVDLKIRGELIDIDSTCNLPDVTLGVVELKNFNINLGLDLPLGSGPGQLSIGVGSKASPIDVEVLMFGGTFWLEIGLGFDGLALPTSTISIGVSVYWEMIELDIIVAHATLTLRLSADFRLEGDEVVFTGAVSLEGEIEVLGLLSASASIVASLTYRSADEEMVLKGTINYCVDSFLGKLSSGSVPIGETTIELGDGGAGVVAGRALRSAAAPGAGSSSFAQRYDPSEWADYCDAFA